MKSKLTSLSDENVNGWSRGMERPARPTMDGERLLTVFAQIVEPMGRSLPASSEVVLHDLSLLPNSIVAVYGDVTGRRVGDPATDLLLRGLTSGHFETTVGYENTLPDGRKLKSSTMIIRDVSGNAVAALCINSDVSVWESLSSLAAMMMGGVIDGDNSAVRQGPAAGTPPEVGGEVFVKDVDELAALLIHQAIQESGIPVELMHKQHKLEVVRALKSRGMFMLRDAVEMIASSLNCTRFTIYNYLNEINAVDESNDDQAVASVK